jgi:Fur family iron response transcriptional regulator
MAKIRVSLATVYNTLHQFTDAGLLREVVVEQGRSYFDTNTSDHHHFFNVDRSELIDIPGDALSVGSLPPAPRGTNVSRVDIIVQVREVDTRS